MNYNNDTGVDLPKFINNHEMNKNIMVESLYFYCHNDIIIRLWNWINLIEVKY